MWLEHRDQDRCAAEQLWKDKQGLWSTMRASDLYSTPVKQKSFTDAEAVAALFERKHYRSLRQ